MFICQRTLRSRKLVWPKVDSDWEHEPMTVSMQYCSVAICTTIYSADEARGRTEVTRYQYNKTRGRHGACTKDVMCVVLLR